MDQRFDIEKFVKDLKFIGLAMLALFHVDIYRFVSSDLGG